MKRLLLRYLPFLGLALAAFFLKDELLSPQNGTEHTSTQGALQEYLPTTRNGKVVQHQFYSLSYAEKYESAEWVAYELTADQVQNKNNVERTDNFTQDPSVASNSAHTDDYRGSGYDRGHLLPAADRDFSEAAMQETFYMSNMSPQDPAFNRGIWKNLESDVRDWAAQLGHLYVVTGPIFTPRVKTYIGENRVGVPYYYYKVLLDYNRQQGIGFILKNAGSDKEIIEFAVPIAEVEKRTGINFFPQLSAQESKKIEQSYDANFWFN